MSHGAAHVQQLCEMNLFSGAIRHRFGAAGSPLWTHCCPPLAMNTCHYRNDSSQMVILRCVGEGAFFFEKVVFPFEDWLFDCPAQSRVDIWSHGLGGAELRASIEADDLLVR